jgi:hypothetical protein
VLALLHGRQGWTTQTDISKLAFKGNAGAADIRAVLTWLNDRGHIQTRKTSDTGGAPRKEYRLKLRKNELSL